jgi:hypothetical protein
LTLAALHSGAQSIDRDAALRRVESVFKKAVLLPAGSPLLEGTLRSAKLANPAVSEDEWAAIRVEVSSAATATFRDDDDAMFKWLRTALQQLSVAELERLASVLEDPAYLKYQAAILAPGAQGDFTNMTIGYMRRFAMAGNEVLAKHGLKVR